MKVKLLSKITTLKRSDQFPLLTILAVLLIATIVSSNLNWGKDYWRNIIESDAKGYYAYLPAVFIYKDLNFGFFKTIEEETYYDENLFFDYRAKHNGKVLNKYYCGTAIATAPFFLGGHLFALMGNGPADGYAKPYSIAITFAALFYLALGLFCMNRLLTRWFIQPFVRSLILLASFFGSHLFYYALIEPGLSHIYSFGLCALFFDQTKKYFDSHTSQSKCILTSSLLLGIIVLIRPSNGLVVLAIPFLAGSWSHLQSGFRRLFVNYKMLLSSLILFLTVLSIQLWIYKLQTGDFWVYSYMEEGFNFAKPAFFEILISYKKGLLLYTPIFCLCLLATYKIYTKSRFAFFSWWLLFLGITYVFSSWWNWWYGGSFSSRVYVEYIPLLVLPLALAVNTLTSGKKILAAAVFFVFIGLCQIQIYQYRYYQIHWEEMTKEKYWDVFLRIDKL